MSTTEPIKLSLRGPTALLDGDTECEFLFSHAQAWQPGIYLWTYFCKQCDRINSVGVAHDSIAMAHAGHVAAFLAGERAFYSAADRAAGRLRRVYAPQDGAQGYVANAADLLAELRQLRIFFAPIDTDALFRTRIAVAIAGHIENLGGKAMEWFDSARTGGIPRVEIGEPVSVQFYRPVIIVNMPDELSV